MTFRVASLGVFSKQKQHTVHMEAYMPNVQPVISDLGPCRENRSVNFIVLDVLGLAGQMLSHATLSSKSVGLNWALVLTLCPWEATL